MNDPDLFDQSLMSPAFLRAVWQASADAMVLSDGDGTVLAANPAYLQLYGYAEQEVVGHNFAIIFPESSRASANSEYRHVFSGARGPAPFQSAIRRKDGAVRVVESRADFIEQDGLRVAMLSSIRDVTERVQQAEALVRSEALFRHTFEGAPLGMALLQPDLRLVGANHALCDLLGYREAELTALAMPQLTHPDDAPLDRELAQLLNGDDPALFEHKVEKRCVTKQGSMVWVLQSSAIVRSSEGKGLYALVMLQDITERTQSDREKARLLGQEREARVYAERAVRAQEDLLSLITHDLRNPTAAIKGAAQLLRRRLQGADPNVERLLSNVLMITDSVARIEKFLDDLSQQPRPGQHLRISSEPTDLVALVQRVAEAHRRQSAMHTVKVHEAVPHLYGDWDAARLEQVLDNLVSNAVKYSPDGGVISIQVGFEQMEGEAGAGLDSKEDVAITCSPPDDTGAGTGAGSGGRRAVLTVRDHGLGIPEGDLPHIFDWYRRGTNVSGIQGTGVGLAGARQIVEQHGGVICAESREGEGSTFTVLLPTFQPASTSHTG